MLSQRLEQPLKALALDHSQHQFWLWCLCAFLAAVVTPTQLWVSRLFGAVSKGVVQAVEPLLLRPSRSLPDRSNLPLVSTA